MDEVVDGIVAVVGEDLVGTEVDKDLRTNPLDKAVRTQLRFEEENSSKPVEFGLKPVNS